MATYSVYVCAKAAEGFWLKVADRLPKAMEEAKELVRLDHRHSGRTLHISQEFTRTVRGT